MYFKFYNLVLIILTPIIIIFFFIRYLSGKEDKKRILEKFSISSAIPTSSKKLIWFHACSVGEIKSTYSLIKKFVQKNYSVLVTTSTPLSSIDVMKNFPKDVIHQYLPIDYSFFINRFLDKWKPKVCIIVESELWPNLIHNTKKKTVPLCLIQARISDKSINNWKYFKFFYKEILQKFNFIIAQSILEKKKIIKSSEVTVQKVINLKNSSPKIDYNKKEKDKLKKRTNNNFIITAVSTHEGEEKIILKSFSNLLKKNKNFTLILQPRHPNRKNSIIKEIKKYSFNYKQRSLKELPDKFTNVYLFDSFGESGLVIALADLIILGGTLVSVGGHNIIESAQLKKCIISGPFYFKISELVDYFNKKNAIVLLKNNSLDQTIYSLFQDKKKMQLIKNNAKKITLGFKNQTTFVYNKIKSLEV